MREKRWTPGPWELDYSVCPQHGTDARSIFHREGLTIQEVVEPGCVCGDESIKWSADAQLIATAPELHESHEWLLDAVHKLAAGVPVRDLDERIEYAKRIDAKAYGENTNDQ